MAVEFRRNLAIWRQVHDEEGSLDDAKFAIGCCRFRVRNGWSAGIFFLGYLLFQIPSSRVLEGLGARRWIAFLLLAWGIVSASMLFIRGHGVFTCCGSCSASQKRDFSLE